MARGQGQSRSATHAVTPSTKGDEEMENMESGTPRLKVGLAEMLKGGVILDVTNAEQA